MSAKSDATTIASLVAAIDEQLRRFDLDRAQLTLREKVTCLVRVYYDVRRVGIKVVVDEHAFDARSAQKRILAYMLEHPGIPLDGSELEVVSGISEYARRIRELRKEKGYHIASGASPDPESGVDLRPDQYLLVSRERDEEAAARWHIANRIRKDPGGSRQRILLYLKENVGSVVTTEELAYVAREAKEFARRTRELRTEHGYAIATRFTGRPDLTVGQYVLESIERVAQPHDRHIPEKVQKEVYGRDDHTCRSCGWTRDRWRREDPRILELHHLKQHVDGGQNGVENLVVLCSRCHDEVHSGNLVLPMELG